MNPEEEYERGYRQAWRGLLGRALGELAAPSPSEHPADVDRVRLATLEAERHDTINALRDLCAEHNLSNEWADALNVADVINYHVFRSLNARRTREKTLAIRIDQHSDNCPRCGDCPELWELIK